MDKQMLIETASSLMEEGKGLLAMDESNVTCNKRFAKAGIPQTEEARRDWRELIVTTPDLNKCISGVILYAETLRQNTKDGIPMLRALMDTGIIPGIKVDTGAKAMAGFPGEKVTEGLDNLRERLSEYVQMGVRFCKWRGVLTIGEGLPTLSCIESNAHALARYAALCQEAGLVPIIEPEVLMEGDHDLLKCFETTEQVLRSVFVQLYRQNILLEGMILKPNMVIPGFRCGNQVTTDEVSDATIKCLLQSVPAAVGGIAFLSGGQSGEMASAHLNSMHVRYHEKLPWDLTFSFARAIQQPAMDIWLGKEVNKGKAQFALYHRASCDQAARLGLYNAVMERNSFLKAV